MQGDKSAATPVTEAAASTSAMQVVAEAAAKLDSEPQPMAVATSMRGRKHTDKTNQEVDDDD